MKKYIMGTRKSVDKNNEIIEVSTIHSEKQIAHKCKEQDCNLPRQNGSSRCHLHTGNQAIAKAFAPKKEDNALSSPTQLPSSS